MSKYRGMLKREKTVDVLLICAIIVSASIIIIPYLIPRPLPETTLRILNYHDVSITNEIEESFLVSTFAEDNNIVDIEWVTPTRSLWETYAHSGDADLVMANLQIMSELEQSGSLRPMTSSIVSEVSETIGGVSMKRYSTGLPVWCGYAFRVIILELLVNETLLQENGLSVPESVEDLLLPGYYPGETNTSLIGFDMPETLSIEHQFQLLITKSLGWENGIQYLTLLYANSRLYRNRGDAFEALLDGEIAITLTRFYGQIRDSLPPTISRTHLENMVVVDPNLVAVTNGTQHQSQSEAFVDYILTPEGQAIWLMHDRSYPWLTNDDRSLPVRREAFDVVEAEVDDGIYAEFNWTVRAGGPGVSNLISREGFALLFYMNSTAFSALSNLTNSWMNIIRAYDNGSINQVQFNQFKQMLGEPLSISDPNTNVSESFTEDYALRILPKLYNVTYEIEIIRLWRIAANQRYQDVVNQLAALL